MNNILNEDIFINSLNSILEASEAKSMPTILIVDDEINNLQLLKRTLRGKYNILTASNGHEGLKVFEEYKNSICLIISDHKMPVMEGTKFFEIINKTSPDTIKILLTGFTDIEILTDAVNKCNLFRYITKPFEPSELEKVVENGIEKFELTSSKSQMLKDVKELFYKTIKSIASALDAKDPYTHGHSVRVTLYALILAQSLGLNEKELEDIETAGLLHDIGKIGIPQNILCKQGRLTDEEFQVIKTHPLNSERLIASVKKLGTISNCIKNHHERWDGRGYPNGLKGEAIPLSARIIALADTYDAMTSTRSYRKALDHSVAMEEIARCSGTQFDPTLTGRFIELSAEIENAKNDPETYYKKYSQLQKEFKTYSSVKDLVESKF